jgi:uncharacterized protein YciI
MSQHVILGWDGTDEGAAARRAAVRPRHLEVITRFAAEGRLKLGVPLFREDGTAAGSLMVIQGDELAAREYLLEEPFAREGVWLSYEVIPFRIADLPWQPLPTSGPAPTEMTHTVTIAEDGTDAGATARRMAVRQAHFDRVRPFAEDGTIAMGGAMFDAAGAMRGSISVTRHATLAEAETFWAEDPYVTGGVWKTIRRWRTRFSPLPYHPL